MAKLTRRQRIELFSQLNLYLEKCQGCLNSNIRTGHTSPDDKCGHCKNYHPIREIGLQLGADKPNLKITFEQYREYKKQGFRDRDIAELSGITRSTMTRYKNRWRKEGLLPPAKRGETNLLKAENGE